MAGLLAASPAAAAHAAADSAEGQRAYAAGHYQDARRLWAASAEGGDAQAQLDLASLYDLGEGVARDPATAYRWYRRAAEAGLTAAEFNVAVMRDTGDGVARDTTDAALWYGRAAAHGDRRAQYNLGQLYAAGDGVPRNPDQARAWFRAAAADLPAAASRLATMRERPARPPAGGRNGTLRTVQSGAPADGDTVRAVAGAAHAAASVELVWVAPAQDVPVRFFIQLMILDGTGSREVFAAYSDETAILAPVGPVPGRYAWRVYAVSRDLRQYAAGDWRHFEVRPPG